MREHLVLESAAAGERVPAGVFGLLPLLVFPPWLYKRWRLGARLRFEFDAQGFTRHAGPREHRVCWAEVQGWRALRRGHLIQVAAGRIGLPTASLTPSQREHLHAWLSRQGLPLG